jgi:hypothetical protein
MLVCVFFVHVAHETAGAARTRSSLRPLFWRGPWLRQSSDSLSRENAESYFVSRLLPSPSSRTSEQSERDPGPIRRGGCCLAAMVDGFPSTMRNCGYGSLRSQGRQLHRQRDRVFHLAASRATTLPCTFFAGVSAPVSAITETETTRSTMASTSLRSHWPSDNLVSRSFSRMV